MTAGIRMLIGQHVELFGHKDSPPTMIGVIDEQCNVTAVVRDAVENARVCAGAVSRHSHSRIQVALPVPSVNDSRGASNA
jgi:hypothetical protein